jgi:vacuolar-type H+-ATPase subunit E/Vma4/5S rRNA maturation endonuclease (ribonuclease M5)
MSYAILRFKKLKNLTGKNSLAGSAKHNFRENNVPNADPERTHLNKTSGAGSVMAVIAKTEEMLESVGTVRKNGVIAIEYLITASPEWFKQNPSIIHEAYFDKAEQWLKNKHGAENVVAVTRQYDETTPHICAYVVPIDSRDRLNASAFFDGQKMLSDMQTDFAEKCGQPFGLNRGIEKSGAKHQTIREYYAKIQAPTPEIKTQVPPEPAPPTATQKLAEIAGFETEYTRAQEYRLEAQRKRWEEEKAQCEAERAKAKQYDMEKANNKSREAALLELRETAVQARELPLEAVLERLDGIRDSHDKNNWKTPTGRISINRSKFFNHDLNKGGGGAIDLVKAQTDADYVEAVNWLAKEFGTGKVLSDVVANLKSTIETTTKERAKIDPLKAHQPDESNWITARNYLIDTRKISSTLIDTLHKQGQIYADKFKNVVFKLDGRTGLALRGTNDKPFHGVRGQKTFFTLNKTEIENKKVAFVESPIDALSLRNLGFSGEIMATIGSSARLTKSIADMYMMNGHTIISAFDNDKAGHAMTLALGECERMLPKGKDWNDDLKAKRFTPSERKNLELQRQKQQANHSQFRGINM